MLYTCSRCQKYKSKRKADVKRHMKNKNSCIKVTQKQIPRDTQQIPRDTQIIPKKEKRWVCEHCNKHFSANSSMNRHIRLYCKEFKLKKENVRLQEEINALQTQIITVNNITNTNTINNQNIIINAYGSEDLQYLLPKLPTLIQHFPTSAVTDVICETYYDPDHPENKSVKIRSTKEKWAQVYNGDKWEMQKKFDVIMNVLQKSFEMIDEFYETNNINHPDYRQNKVTWDRVREMWINDEYPDKEMIDTTEEILTNQNQSHSYYRTIIKGSQKK